MLWRESILDTYSSEEKSALTVGTQIIPIAVKGIYLG